MSKISTHAIATSLPPPSRTVYKCEVGGKVHYADSPCVGAQKVDVTPTRGMNAQQLDQAGRRMKLSAEAQVACRRLDHALPRAERAEQAARGSSALQARQLELFKLRKRYRELRCD
ncbi:hypothetical protein WNB94_10760 [Aquabacterium sp. A3]|uniref:hypothetical protein n=1 Tax=Aquabacterium sp. A3 TaxID=3132829 RepID=UPI00311A452F